MSKNKSVDDIIQHKNNAITKLQRLIDKFIESEPSKADKFSYWIEDYASLIGYEKEFNPKSLKEYKRGDIVKINFGFRIGHELGGLHYAVVMDNHNPPKAPMITVIPLISLKPHIDINSLPVNRLYLGNDLVNDMKDKCQNQMRALDQDITAAEDRAQSQKVSKNEISNLRKRYNAAIKIYQETQKMKHGSIALVGQITTISKMRIQDPKNSKGVLSGIHLSGKYLDLIDQRIRELFTYNK